MKDSHSWARDLPGFGLAEQGKRLCVSTPVAGRNDPRPTLRAERLPHPIRHRPAGALDHWHQRAEIVQTVAGFNDEIDEAARKQAEGMTIAAPVLHIRGPPNPIEGHELVLREPAGPRALARSRLRKWASPG